MMISACLGFVTNYPSKVGYLMRHTASQLGVFFFLLVCEWNLIRIREAPEKYGKNPRWSDIVDDQEEEDDDEEDDYDDNDKKTKNPTKTPTKPDKSNKQ